MIMEGVRTLLLGMLGIFLVMGLLVLVLMLMNYLAKKWSKKNTED